MIVEISKYKKFYVVVAYDVLSMHNYALKIPKHSYVTMMNTSGEGGEFSQKKMEQVVNALLKMIKF